MNLHSHMLLTRPKLIGPTWWSVGFVRPAPDSIIPLMSIAQMPELERLRWRSRVRLVREAVTARQQMSEELVLLGALLADVEVPLPCRLSGVNPG